MINAASVLTTYADVTTIKGSRVAKEESKLLAVPRQATIDAVINALTLKFGELTFDDLLQSTELSPTALRNCLLYLVREKKILRRPISVYGTGFTYKYSVVRGDL